MDVFTNDVTNQFELLLHYSIPILLEGMRKTYIS